MVLIILCPVKFISCTVESAAWRPFLFPDGLVHISATPAQGAGQIVSGSCKHEEKQSERTCFRLSREKKEDSTESSQNIFYYKNNVRVELRALTHGKNSRSCLPKGRTQGHAYPGVELMVLTQGYNSGRFPREYNSECLPKGQNSGRAQHACIPTQWQNSQHAYSRDRTQAMLFHPVVKNKACLPRGRTQAMLTLGKT